MIHSLFTRSKTLYTKDNLKIFRLLRFIYYVYIDFPQNNRLFL